MLCVKATDWWSGECVGELSEEGATSDFDEGVFPDSVLGRDSECRSAASYSILWRCQEVPRDGAAESVFSWISLLQEHWYPLWKGSGQQELFSKNDPERGDQELQTDLLDVPESPSTDRGLRPQPMGTGGLE